MLQSLKPESSLEDNFKTVYDQLMSGRAFAKFQLMVQTQDGHLLDFFKADELSKNNTAQLVLDPQIHAQKITITSDYDGEMNYVDVKTLGFAAVSLGAGRLTKEDEIDLEVGFYCHKKQTDRVKKSEALFDVYYNNENKLALALEKLKLSFEIKPTSELKTPNAEKTQGQNENSNSKDYIYKNLVKEILTFDGKNYSQLHLKTKFFEV
jgi:pyrimidine-nucleoside phosphorylase